MHQPFLKGLLTRLGIHGPHIHFERPHQGAASKQVLRMDNLPEQNHKQSVRLGREKPLGMGVGVAKAGAGLVCRGSASAPPAPHYVPPPSTAVMGEQVLHSTEESS